MMSGRTSLKGKKRKEKKFGYTYEFKKAVIRSLEDVGTEATIQKYWRYAGIQQKRSIRPMILKWRRSKTKIVSVKTTKAETLRKLRPDGVSVILPAEIEDEISGSIRRFRAEGAPISESMVAGRRYSWCRESPSSKDSRRAGIGLMGS
jgi:hypothetical protein